MYLDGTEQKTHTNKQNKTKKHSSSLLLHNATYYQSLVNANMKSIR